MVQAVQAQVIRPIPEPTSADSVVTEPQEQMAYIVEVFEDGEGGYYGTAEPARRQMGVGMFPEVERIHWYWENTRYKNAATNKERKRSLKRYKLRDPPEENMLRQFIFNPEENLWMAELY